LLALVGMPHSQALEAVVEPALIATQSVLVAAATAGLAV
jgi:hypothetical protein